MKIYSMTATFGKLEHQTLQLQPGLNIIEAPNEWGKSTWCAFLVNMLYGLDTRARSTGAALADKERYVPWSGSPMAGRIDLNWNGRDITIERSSKGRILFGNFRAYETDSGIDIPQLNGTNCGQMLLGVERSVFARAGFLKLSDLPVTQDDSLRRRLNNLVTTGDESDTGDQLGEQLKNLKNKCRHNRTGLLPQAEQERDQLKNQLSELHSLRNQASTVRDQQAQLAHIVAELENHADALAYTASQDDIRRIADAQAQLQETKQQLSALIATCSQLPQQEQLHQNLQAAKQLQEQHLALQAQERMLPPMPEKPQLPEGYQGVDAARCDEQENEKLTRAKKKNTLIFGISLALAAVVLICGFALQQPLYPAVGAVAIILAAFAVCAVRAGRIRTQILSLYARHDGLAPGSWVADAQRHADRLIQYETLLSGAISMRQQLQSQKDTLQAQTDKLTGGQDLIVAIRQWEDALRSWLSLADTRRELQRLDEYTAALQSMAKTCEPPRNPDRLTYTAEENARLLSQARDKQHQLQLTLGQCQGQMESLGSENLIRARLDTLNHRIARLEDHYYALEMAQDALRDATQQLQRRFAPRISRRAQELFARLTGGRYERLTLGQDLSISTSARDEDTLHSAQWRSDGTADQQYLALRLAVAEELTPDAPMILDDALVRFDDDRLRAALEILKEESEAKQVILFTCQHREKQWEANV